MKQKVPVSLILALFVFFLIPQTVSAQAYAGKGRLKGIVTTEDGKPLEGVKVKLFHVKSASGFETKTNGKGEWKAIWIRGGTWNVDFNKVGYEPKKNSVEMDEIHKDIVMSIKLKKLEGLVLTEDLLPQVDKANILFAAGQVDEALTIFEGILKENPETYIINLSIGNCHFKKGAYDQAIASYQKILDKNPQYFKAVIAIGSSYMNKKDTDKAMEWYNKIDVAQIDDPTVLYNIGTEYFNQLRYQDALKYYRKAVELQPTDEDSLYQLGLTNLTLGNYKDAVTAFETFLKVSPESERAGQVRGFIDFLKTKI